MRYGKTTVLVIDDEKDFTFFLRANLERAESYHVIEVNDPKRAMAAARKNRPDVILLDITMPGADGFAILEALKRDSRTTSIPVIMLTALTDQESKTRAASLYNEDFISKPVEIGELRQAIDRVSSRARRLQAI